MSRRTPAKDQPRFSIPENHKWYMVTDEISGYVNNKNITAKRGQQILLTEEVARLFKDRILEIDYGIFI